MTQYEFIQELEQALRGEVSPQVIEYNVNYYNEYIREQLAMGKTQEEVFDMLGSPLIIAKTIISSEKARSHEYEDASERARSYEYGEASEIPQEEHGFFRILEKVLTGEWYYKVFAVLAVLFVLYLIFSLLFAVVRVLFWPVLIVVVICAVVEYVKKKWRGESRRKKLSG